MTSEHDTGADWALDCLDFLADIRRTTRRIKSDTERLREATKKIDRATGEDDDDDEQRG